MAAKTRWVQYDTSAIGVSSDGTTGCRGTSGYSISTSSTSDVYTLGSTTNRLYISLDNEAAPYITLASGIELDPRFIAKEITERLHDLGKNTVRWENSICVWENNKSSGANFRIESGTLGSASSVIVSSGIDSCAEILGFGTKLEQGGLSSPAHGNAYGFDGTVTVSGIYQGKDDEIYKVVISNDTFSESVVAVRGIAEPIKDVLNSYTGNMSTGGAFNAAANIIYTISINTANGTTVGAGTSNVPTMTWTSTGSDSSTSSTELLYADFWYHVGDWGLKVKFSDAVFNTSSPAWQISCYKPDYVQGTNAAGPVGLAQYVFSSSRDDFSSLPITTSSGVFTRLGSRGLTLKFNPTGGADEFHAGDEFYIKCSAPKPAAYDISGINYGNVTVSTESLLKSVTFEIISGAVDMSTVRFGLQSHGSFVHHNGNNNDTMFRLGTVGQGNKAGLAPDNGIEWVQNLVPSDISSDTPPSYLYFTKGNLPVAATADDSIDIGSTGLVSDNVWINIKLGSAETGANSSINYRLYFDYA